MNRFRVLVAFVCFARLALASAPVAVSTSHLFVATGFDDNDEVTVTLDGYLPTPCYQLAEAQVVRDVANGRVLIQQMAYVSEGICPQVIVPFVNSVHIGRLPVGTYRIMTTDGKQSRALSVGRARIPTVDDYLYAPVESAMVAPMSGGLVAVLTGRYMNTCLRMRAIPVTVTGDTVQVQPIMELRKSDDAGRPCRKVELPFRVTQRIPALRTGRYLLHVRSLNGRSVESVFSVGR